MVLHDMNSLFYRRLVCLCSMFCAFTGNAWANLELHKSKYVGADRVGRATLLCERQHGGVRVIGPRCEQKQGTQTIFFIYVADFNSNFYLGKDKYSRICSFFDEVRKENPYTLFSNAGDYHEKGSIAEQYSHGVAVTAATRAMQFDVRTIGNHDFAWGVEHLLDLSHDAHSLILMSNTDYVGSDTQGLGSVKYGVMNVGCLRVGFFGMVSLPWDELNKKYLLDSDTPPSTCLAQPSPARL